MSYVFHSCYNSFTMFYVTYVRYELSFSDLQKRNYFNNDIKHRILLTLSKIRLGNNYYSDCCTNVLLWQST